MIHIDRVNADVQVLRSPAPGAAETGGTPIDLSDAGAMDRLRIVVMEVLREHLRDLERQGRL